MVDTKNMKEFFTSTKFLVILGLSMIFLGIGFYIYNYHIAPKLNPNYVPNDEFHQNITKENNYAEIFLFSASWCPYSKKVLPIWNGLKEEYKNTPVNDYILKFVNLDVDKDSEDFKSYEEETKKKIDGFPTIIIKKNNQIIEFEAQPTKSNLNEFINSVL